jgi:signal transduction histidine kinase
MPATPAGGHPARVVVDFKDTGPGMSAEERQRAFSSVLSTSKAGGTGLGLPIVRRVVEAHRGTLEIKSRPGHGSMVSVLLAI